MSNFPQNNNNSDQNNLDQCEQNPYGDLIYKVQNKEKLSEFERSLFCHDYVQRYSDRILNEEENYTYKYQKLFGEVSGIALAFHVPMSTALFIQQRYDAAYYGPKARKMMLMTLVWGGLFMLTKSTQNQFLEEKSRKYFSEMTDQELVDYQLIQQAWVDQQQQIQQAHVQQQIAQSQAPMQANFYQQPVQQQLPQDNYYAGIQQQNQSDQQIFDQNVMQPASQNQVQNEGRFDQTYFGQSQTQQPAPISQSGLSNPYIQDIPQQYQDNLTFQDTSGHNVHSPDDTPAFEENHQLSSSSPYSLLMDETEDQKQFQMEKEKQKQGYLSSAEKQMKK